MALHTPESDVVQNQQMERYYRLQSKIYDATRWTFLFGRNKLIRVLPSSPAPSRILEVGCGTGFNLVKLATKYPNAQITGLDVSTDMVELSAKKTAAFGDRVEVLHQPYMAGETVWNERFDLILFSYSLTMINPQWLSLLEQAKLDLKPGGMVAMTDFHNSQFQWFKDHMGNNHVRMDGHILPVLEEMFKPVRSEVNKAYLGVWEWVLFMGKKE